MDKFAAQDKVPVFWDLGFMTHKIRRWGQSDFSGSFQLYELGVYDHELKRFEKCSLILCNGIKSMKLKT